MTKNHEKFFRNRKKKKEKKGGFIVEYCETVRTYEVVRTFVLEERDDGDE